MSAVRSTVLALLVGLLSVYVIYPPPDLSQRVSDWKASGGYFTFKGFNIFYHDSQGLGPASEVLVVFHGYPSSSYDFSKIWPNLTEKFGRVIAADFLGYGLSDKPVQYDYSIVDQSNMVEALLEKLGVTAVHILAHDMGDTVGQEIIARYNEGKAKFDIKSVCLMNGGILPETINFRLGQKKHNNLTRSGWIEVIKLLAGILPETIDIRLSQKILLNPYLALVAMRLMGKLSYSRGLGEVFGPHTKPTDDEMNDQWALMRYNDGNLVQHGVIQYLPQRFANRERWVPALSNTDLPLHLIYGPADPVNPAGTFLIKYKELVKNSGVTELDKDIGHYPQIEAPQKVVQAYFNFLDSLIQA